MPSAVASFAALASELMTVSSATPTLAWTLWSRQQLKASGAQAAVGGVVGEGEAKPVQGLASALALRAASTMVRMTFKSPAGSMAASSRPLDFGTKSALPHLTLEAATPEALA